MSNMTCIELVLGNIRTTSQACESCGQRLTLQHACCEVSFLMMPHTISMVRSVRT